jgi:hypothetical protein
VTCRKKNDADPRRKAKSKQSTLGSAKSPGRLVRRMQRIPFPQSSSLSPSAPQPMTSISRHHFPPYPSPVPIFPIPALLWRAHPLPPPRSQSHHQGAPDLRLALAKPARRDPNVGRLGARRLNFFKSKECAIFDGTRAELPLLMLFSWPWEEVEGAASGDARACEWNLGENCAGCGEKAIIHH